MFFLHPLISYDSIIIYSIIVETKGTVASSRYRGNTLNVILFLSESDLDERCRWMSKLNKRAGSRLKVNDNF